MWYPLYIWVMVGKWRRWCIPGALISVVITWLQPLIGLMLRDYPIAQVYLKTLFFSLVSPLNFLLKNEYSYYKVLIIIVVFGWFALIGAGVGYVIGFFWKLLPKRARSDKCDSKMVEMIEL